MGRPNVVLINCDDLGYGDARLGIVGEDVRPLGRVEQAAFLTAYDPDHPYYAAEYDLPDRG